MAGSYNKVLLMGNLTRDVELKYTQSNRPVANIGIAVNRRWRNQEGQQQEETTFVDCEAWGRTAEVMSQYLSKGRPVFIEGRLRLDQWQDQQGNNRSKLKVVVDTFQFVDSGGGQRQGGPPARDQSPQHAPAGGSGATPGNEPIQDDDIPF